MTLVRNKKYPAVITDCGLTEPKEAGQQPQPFVQFELTDESGGKSKMTWYGSTGTESATEYAAKQLLKIGFGGKDFNDLKQGVMIFAPTKLTVELEHKGTKDASGKYVPDTTKKLEIKWINASGGAKKFTGTVPSQVGLFARIKAELGVKTAATTTASKPVPSDW